jgi:uncharacterized membrane protein
MTDELEREGPVERYEHDHPPVRNVIEEHERGLLMGQRIADALAAAVGSWPFILIQSLLLFSWIAANVYLAIMVHRNPGFLRAWDPYPFILLNLVLSFQAAYTGPVVMMSQNRAAQKDRLMAQHDYEVNCRTELEMRIVMDHLAHQDQLILAAISSLEGLKLEPRDQPEVSRIDALLHRIEEHDRNLLAILQRLGAGSPPAAG